MIGIRIGSEDQHPGVLVSRIREYRGPIASVVHTATMDARDMGLDIQYHGDLGNRPRHAAKLAAHAIRLHTLALPEAERPDWAYGGGHMRLHTVALLDPEVGDAISADSSDIRLAAGRGLIRGLQDSFTADDEPARLIGRWLTRSLSTPEGQACAGHLARWLVDHLHDYRYRDALTLAWWRIHAHHVLYDLATPADPAGGRPPADVKERRALLRNAVRRIWQAGGLSKQGLAGMAGISRPTLDSWLAGEPDPLEYTERRRR